MTKRKAVAPAAAPARRCIHLDRVLVYCLALSLFAVPLFILPSATEYGYTKTILALVVVSALLVLWGLDGWVKRSWAVRVPWITWPFLAFVAACLFSLLHATNGRFVVQSLVLLVYFFLLLVLIANVVREKRDVAILLGAFLASTTLIALYGLLQFAGVMRGPGEGQGISQVISTLGNKEYVAGVLAYIFFPAIILLFRLRSAGVRALVILVLAFDFGSLLLFQQAGANVALIAAALAFLVAWIVFRPLAPVRRARRWILALLLALACAYLVEAPSGPLNSVVGLSADSTSWLGRVWKENSGATRSWDWWVGYEMWTSSPWVGVGLGNYKLDFLPYKAQFLATPRGEAYDFYIARAAQAHNEYVQVLAEVGILGALALVALLGTLVVSLVRRLLANRDPDDRLDLLLACAGLVAVGVHAAVSFPAHLPASSLAAILACGIALSPAYGPSGAQTLTIRGWRLRTAVVVLAVVGVVVSVVALRDLRANVLLRQGVQDLQLGQAAQAKATLQESIKLDFAPHEAYLRLATAQAVLGDLSGAFASVSLCRTRFVDENTYAIYAELATNLGKYAEAKAAVDLLLATHPDSGMQTRARYLRAVIAAREGNAADAIVQLRSLITDAPDFEPAQIVLASILASQGQRDEAEKIYSQALDLVQRKLAADERQLASSQAMSTSAYGELRSSIASLRSERDAILQRLKSLRGS